MGEGLGMGAGCTVVGALGTAAAGTGACEECTGPEQNSKQQLEISM
jgi:hypothetical protein